MRARLAGVTHFTVAATTATEEPRRCLAHPMRMATTTEIGPPSGGGPRKFEPRGRIDISRDGDLAHWLKVLATTHPALPPAIPQVGDDAADVAQYLKRRSHPEPPPGA